MDHAHSTSFAQLHDLRIDVRSIGSLTLRRSNPRTHSKQQIRQIADSIEAFGFTNPVLIDADGTVVAGHGRVRAAKELGLERVPTITLEHLSDAQLRAYVIADNKLAELAGWDRDVLAIELQELAALDLDFDLELTGFATAEIDLLLGVADDEVASDAADAAAAIDPESPATTRDGDLWQIGPHRLLCGNALDAAAYDRVLSGRRARVVFVDPPYNVRIDGHVSGLGRHRHREFAMACGEMTPEQFTRFLETALRHHSAHSLDGALHFVCIDWRHTGDLLAASRPVYSELKNICVWAKSNAGMGSLYRSQHEFVLVFKVGTASHVNNIELGRHGRYRTNVWRYAGANTIGTERDEALAIHPTVKPVRMVADAILDTSRRGEVVLDGFAGSGTTLLAAERTGRVGLGIELDPQYVDAALERLAAATGLVPTLAATGEPFAAVAARRASEAADSGDCASDSAPTLEVES